MEQAPHGIGRDLDLATYPARSGRIEESDTAFRQAEELNPHDLRKAFARAMAVVEHKRSLAEACQSAEKLLQQAQGS